MYSLERSVHLQEHLSRVLVLMSMPAPRLVHTRNLVSRAFRLNVVPLGRSFVAINLCQELCSRLQYYLISKTWKEK